ncbi:MAG: TolC family protein [Bacteroidales bacterium]
MKKINMIGLVMIVFQTMTVAAQNRTWNMDDCMSFAIRNSSGIKIQELNNRNYKEDKKASVGALFPSVNAGVGVNSNFGRSIDPETNTYSNISNFSNGYEISGSMPLFQAGALLSNIKANKVICQMGLEETQRKKDDVSIETMQAFADYLYYLECVDLAAEKLKQSEALLYKTRRMETMGMKSQADVAQIEAQLAADDYSLVRQKNLSDQALLKLKDVMNYPVRDILQVDTTFIIPPCLPDDRSGEEIYELAKFWNPVAKVAEMKLKEAELRRQIARAKLFPTLSLQGGISTRFYENLKEWGNQPAFGPQFRNNLGEWVGISLNIPLFNGLSKSSAMNKAKNNARIAREEYDEILRRLQIEIEKVQQDCRGLLKENEQMKRKVEADELAYKVTERKYEKGLLSVFDLQTSANTLLQSRVNQLQIQMNYLIKSRLADYYSGKPLIRN